MKQTVSFNNFQDAFKTYNRNDFSYDGLRALYDYLKELDENTELDVIALCCDFSEYNTALECIQDLGYPWDFSGSDEEKKETAALDYLRGETTVIEFDGGIIIQGF